MSEGVGAQSAQLSLLQRARTAAVVMLLVGSLLPIFGVSLVTVAALLIAPAVLWTVVRGLPILHRSICLAVIAAALIGLPALLRPATSDYGTNKISAFFTLTLFTACAAVLVRDRTDLALWAKAWVISGCVLALLALTGAADQAGRAVGDYGGNPIWLARAIGSPAVALLWLAYQQHLKKKVALCAAVVLVAGVVATGSRGPTIAMAIGGLLVIAMSSPKQRVVRAAVVVFLAASAVWLATSLHLVAASSRIGALLIDPATSAYSSDRFDLAQPTIRVVLAHPGGIGFGNWHSYVPILAFLYPHNLWLEVLCEAGWVTGLFFLALVGRVAYRLWRASSASPPAVLLLALLAFEITCVSVSGDLNARTFWFVLALGYAVSFWPWQQADARQGSPSLVGSDSGVAGSTVAAST